MAMHVKIRGIYSTALTKLFMDSGHIPADPSSAIRRLFGMNEAVTLHDVLIQDRENLQGVYVSGEPEKVSRAVALLQQQLFDAALLRIIPIDEPEGLVKAVMELPGLAKDILDNIRRRVTPTLAWHHRFRVIASKTLEKAESALAQPAEQREEIGHRLFREIILVPLEKSGIARLEHIRPSGKGMRPREGIIVELGPKNFTFRRGFGKGRYDGLDLPIGTGDYGLTEIREGAWFVKHSYYAESGALIGEYYNINTPVELYPYGARYLDLELDVVRRAGEKPFLIDREKLSLLTGNGCISKSLEDKAVAVAEEILRRLSSTPPSD